ncbi:M3 family oligoendopeptidase [Vibrio sp. 10N.261.46.E12]|uniref:M3 family oligoendopeptidase n=1 Tax=unclassified Vibrio TaxID=2614977 RepID=UPI0009778667|nr:MULTISPECIES: M3 family oligoendopeptidase [unclassified Vibrio]OMO37921.1 oligoendopeptidase F [Vibrio sp. 10N.261.45.E1]PMJ25017.1 oligoendopeptidase F [Vibrio sp. 10N.286.45.B6]PML93809.1 oligoendopeptidase F [Vibrio sp. 10N.261.49.E11]PMM68127.1 oligoendopeptidase F [Vibrio sp. 10N.261.46.F12]PMM90124.1 oligoendopeptidase F [Vibrio sp. 10N.261.46.E8]
MTTPSWDLSIAYRDLDDAKIEQDIELIQQCIELLYLHVEKRHIILAMQNAIQTSEAAGTLLSTINTFANCHASVDATHTEAKALLGRVAKLNSEMSQAFSPYEDTLIHSEPEFIDAVLEHESADVAGQRFAIESSRKLASSRLSVAEEQLLAAMTVDGRDAWGRLYDNLTGSLKLSLKLDGEEEALGFSQAASLLYGGEFDKQEPAWRAVQGAMKTHQESFASILNALAGWRLTENKKRSKISDVHFLDPSLHGSRIVPETLDTMMSVAKANRAVGQKAGLLMARVHGLDEMKPWNHLAAMPPLGDAESKVYPFDEAIEVIKTAFAEVNPEMADFVALMVENGWIDAAPAANKRLGAYCTKFAATRTPLVFMTWSGSRSDLMTLAHELGHAFHNWVMKDMPLCKTRYPMTLAETASIFAENIVRDHLLTQAQTRNEKLEMLWEELSSSLALMVNIPVRFEFEKAFYEQREKGELTAQQLCDLMETTWKEWYGEAMTEADPYFWASKLHFSISQVSFYNYPYLFGYLFSKGVYAQRDAKGEQFYDDYVSLLRDTGSMMAEEVVQKHLGMDLTQADFWQQSIDMVKVQIDEFERLLNQED